MGWLQRKREAATAELYGKTSRTYLPIPEDFSVNLDHVCAEGLTFTFIRERPRAGSLEITTTDQLLSAVLFGEFVAVGVEIQEVVRRTVPTAIEPTEAHYVSPDIMFQFLSFSSSKLALGAVAERFRFDEPRLDPPQLFCRRALSVRTGSRSPRAQMPEPPPSTKKSDITERLRLLLMPPVDELLSDPELGLPAEPFKYQKEGIWWLMQRQNALLADEMGLGKTMQAIVAARLLWKERRINRILVVCPKTLIPTWQKEFRTWWAFSPNYMQVCEGDRRWFLKLATKNIVVKIINYEALAREVDWIETERFSHDLVIIDEAQRIKNPANRTARAVKALKSDRRWALTGTPLENKIDDVASIFGFVMPGLLRGDDHDAVRKGIGPYMLRRRTEEVLPDLPPKFELDVPVELTTEQRSAYDEVERDGVRRLNELGETITIVHVFQLIGELRGICNVDASTGQSAKLDLLREDLEEIIASGRKALIFSDYTGDRGITWLESKLREFAPLCLHGEVASKERPLLVDRFNEKPDNKIMLLNYKVGGVGLNLQGANYVYLFDRWWNPAVEEQAVKRAHRLGQTDRVFVKRFFCKGTIEERILQKLSEKRRLFKEVIDGASPDENMALDREEFFELFEDLRVRPRLANKASQESSIILDNLDPKQFEELIAQLYEKQGYKATVTGKSHDGGVDITAMRFVGSDRVFTVIQCKHQAASVGPDVVRELWGVVNNDTVITGGVVATSSRFTPSAREFAKNKRLTLLDRTDIERLVSEYKVAILAERIVSDD